MTKQREQRNLSKAVGWLGPSWRAAPARRLAQVVSLALFLYLFFHVASPYARVFARTALAEREWLPVESFLWFDPLVGLSTAIAARAWNIALLGALAVLAICALIPRGFCGYVCPLGTLIDAFDWLFGRLRSAKTRARANPTARKRRWNWASTRYLVLAAVLGASAGGALLSGFVSPIPVLTRGLMFTGGRLQFAAARGWNEVGPVDWTFYLSLALFAFVFAVSLFGRRFWCRYLCPSGALFSLFNLGRLTERRVAATCVSCGKCEAVCSFGAIAEDYSTRPLDCAFCQTCGGVCPTRSISYGARAFAANGADGAGATPKPAAGRRTAIPERPISRRAFVMAPAVGASAIGGAALALAMRARPPRAKLLRPPGSAPEAAFLDLCVRCGECFKVCPGPVLHAAGLEAGLDAMWTPVAVPTVAGCHPDCNFCTQVCPTRAIRPLSFDEKRRTHIGLGVVNPKTCLPHSGQSDCRLCFEECEAAGYHAIEMREIRLEVGEIPEGVYSDDELEAMGRIEAPFVDPARCVGCGLCEYRCHAAYVKGQKLLDCSAIVVVAENEDRPA